MRLAKGGFTASAKLDVHSATEQEKAIPSLLFLSQTFPFRY